MILWVIFDMSPHDNNKNPSNQFHDLLSDLKLKCVIHFLQVRIQGIRHQMQNIENNGSNLV